METIISYLNNLFANLPNTARVKRIKNELAVSMEEKYQELKRQGKSENEAIGIVISEFGNINELIDELGLKTENNKLVVDKDEIKAYQLTKKKSGLFIAFGVMLCLMGVISLLLSIQLVNDKIIFANVKENYVNIIGIIPLFVLISIAVALFIFSESFMSKYRVLEKGVSLPYSLNQELQEEYQRFQTKFTISLVVGVVICLISVATMIVNVVVVELNALYAVSIMLAMISIAIWLFIYFGSIKEGYDYLGVTPEGKERKKINKKAEKIISTVASIIWPLTVVVYLILGFGFDKWQIGWIVFPIVAILFGAFSGAIKNYYKD
ncbi:TPA: hypothetical protein GXZ54_03900 [bacterium]|nr:hypothetical protein [bacterium]